MVLKIFPEANSLEAISKPSSAGDQMEIFDNHTQGREQRKF